LPDDVAHHSYVEGENTIIEQLAKLLYLKGKRDLG
jgi:hypothetical protein